MCTATHLAAPIMSSSTACGDNELWQTHNKGQHNHTTQKPYGMEESDKQLASTNEGGAESGL